MHINDLDLNLLRLFEAVYMERNVSRAAERLGLTQPAASQALTRLRLALADPLFERAPGGVRPSQRAQRLAPAIQAALAALDEALRESTRFDPLTSNRIFNLHLSDIGEARFLPDLMAALSSHAPAVRLASEPLAHDQIAGALDSGRIDVALGFLPTVQDTQQVEVLHDVYGVMLRTGHPFVRRVKRRNVDRLTCPLDDLRWLDFAAVRSHGETLRILQALGLEGRLRLTAAHFLALPAIVRATDLAVLMPRSIARGFAADGAYTIVEPDLPLRDFTVSLHWSRRFAAEPGNTWLRNTIVGLFSNG